MYKSFTCDIFTQVITLLNKVKKFREENLKKVCLFNLEKQKKQDIIALFKCTSGDVTDMKSKILDSRR